MSREILRGAAAGAAGSTALNAVSYLDMAVRGRPASSTPEQTVDAIANRLRQRIPGEGKARDSRRTGLGAVAGITLGVGFGILFSVLKSTGVRMPTPVAAVASGMAVMAASDLSMTVLGVTDPRSWSVGIWVSDLIPHLVYGVVTAATLDALSDRQRHPRR